MSKHTMFLVRGCVGTGSRGSTESVSFQRGVLEPFNFGKIQEKLDILALLLPNFRFLPLSRKFRTPPFKSAAPPLLVCAETDLLRGNFSLTYFLIFHWKIIKVSTGATAKEGQKIDILLIRLYQKFISERSSICKCMRHIQKEIYQCASSISCIMYAILDTEGYQFILVQLASYFLTLKISGALENKSITIDFRAVGTRGQGGGNCRQVPTALDLK